ncbi:MAG: phospho-sugar mutase [Oscillospiraceae bacterium]
MKKANTSAIADVYYQWLNHIDDPKLLEELDAIKDNQNEIYERFYKCLEFGTAGLRGIIGAGTNRMNIYTVAKATQGYANCITKLYKNSSVAIAYDSRIFSDLFAKTTARVFAANNIKVYLFSELMPTPILSYAVRTLKCQAGIVITASHNPSQYNGYKAYNSEGCQIDEATAEKVLEEICKLDTFSDIKYADFDEAIADGKIEYINSSLAEKFVEETYNFVQDKNICKKTPLKVVYTPLNGAGYKWVTSILNKINVSDLHIVESQKNPDGNFPTCTYPNPEMKEALAEGLKLSQNVGADILLASDPDSDRLGAAVLHNGAYQILTGNQVGILMADYICRTKSANNTMPKNPVMIKSAVSSNMLEKIAEDYNVEVKTVLTGFKNVGNCMEKLSAQNRLDDFIFAYEESCGYLSTTLVRDKDSICACALCAEMAAFHKSQGKTLVDALEFLYQKYGYYISKSQSFEFIGASGENIMNNIMENLRNNPPKKFSDFDVISTKDFLLENELKTNMIKVFLSDNVQFIVRPSGTEPKIKFYYYIIGKNENERDEILSKIVLAVENFVKTYK